MELIKKTFKECDLYFLEKNLGLVVLDEMEILNSWLDAIRTYATTEFENLIINQLQKKIKYRVHDWNEIELNENFIAPLLNIVDFNTKEYGMFSERLIKATIGEYELSGCPDAMVAKGHRRPEIPYFCFHEYKKEKDNEGDPHGQCLAAMLVAQENNNNEKPIYGVVVKGKDWSFMVLQGKEYAISRAYNATISELFEIVKLLKHLKTIIEEYVKS